jgi:hypothetical protein
MDKAGNTYFTEPDALNHARPLKRMIEPKDTIYDPARCESPHSLSGSVTPRWTT